jgi:hypothetical protein
MYNSEKENHEESGEDHINVTSAGGMVVTPFSCSVGLKQNSKVYFITFAS